MSSMSELQAVMPDSSAPSTKASSKALVEKQKTSASKSAASPRLGNQEMIRDIISKTAHLGAHADMNEVKEILQWTNGRTFQVVVASIIVANSIFLGVETDYYRPQDYRGKFDPWKAVNVIFAVVFTIELSLRLYSMRSSFIKDHWNKFDSVLVGMSVVDTFILDSLSTSEDSAIGMLSVMRVLRILRVARIARLLRFFKPLWLLVTGVMEAMRALLWAWILISILIYVFAIFLIRTVGFPHKKQWPLIDSYFGDVLRSMFTLFQVMTLEGWPTVARAAMEPEPWVWMVFGIFLILTTFSIMNMIVSVIVDSTLDQASDQKLSILQQKEAETVAAVVKIDEVFKFADADRDGVITKEELLDALEVKEVQNYLREIGIDMHHAEYIFDIVDYDDSGSLDASEFSLGLIKARGEAKAQDVLAMQCDLWRREKNIREDLEKFCQTTDGRLSNVDWELDCLRGDLAALGEGLGVRLATRDRSGSGTP